MTRIYILVSILISFILLLGYGWGLMKFMMSPASENKQVVVFEVSPGANLNQVAYKLRQKKLISSLIKFQITARLADVSTKIKQGEYELHTQMSPMEILKILSQGKGIEYSVTFQEGLNMYEMAQIFEDKGFGEKKDFLSLCRDKSFVKALLGREVDSLEGYLFPDTYLFTKNVGTKLFIETMVKRFKSVYKEVLPLSKIKMPIHNHIILASIIEKETGASRERSTISSVFHNRLRKKMRLQSDPTILYGILDRTGVMPRNITKKDIREYTRYNTYTIPVLPYGPISNPGRETLEATVRPSVTDYLFFVSNNNGSHVFSRTLEEHNAAVRKWQLNAKNREGRSWRNLKKAVGE